MKCNILVFLKDNLILALKTNIWGLRYSSVVEHMFNINKDLCSVFSTERNKQLNLHFYSYLTPHHSQIWSEMKNYQLFLK